MTRKRMCENFTIQAQIPTDQAEKLIAKAAAIGYLSVSECLRALIRDFIAS
jgi:hypothetical protein